MQCFGSLSPTPEEFKDCGPLPKAELSRDWDQRGAQSRAFPESEWAPQSEAEAIAVLALLWMALSNPDPLTDYSAYPAVGDPPAIKGPQGAGVGLAPEDDPAERIRLLRRIPAQRREALLQVLRDRKAAREAALRILRGLRAHRLRVLREHHGISVRRTAPIPEVLCSQRIRIHLDAHPTHAP